MLAGNHRNDENPLAMAAMMNGGMNGMWNNPFVQENLIKLKNHGYHIIEPADGFLACGTNGVGRMREPEEIFAEVKKELAKV